MITVTYLVSTLADCGPVNVLWGIVRNLDRRKFRSVIVTLSPEPEISSIGRFEEAEIEIRKVGLSRSRSFIAGREHLRKTISSINPSVIHSHGFRGTILMNEKSSQVPTMATLHCDLRSYYRFAYGVPVGSIMYRLEYRALRRCAAVVAVSESVRASARDHGIESTVISNGIDLKAYTPPGSPAEIEALRSQLGWPTDAVVIIHTGALTPGKRPLAVIDAFLNSRWAVEALLVFAGEGPLMKECIDAARGSRRVLFLGRRSDVPSLLRASNILVSNSMTEGLPLSLLEACASGLTIVATDIDPHRKIEQMFPDQVHLYGSELQGALAAVMEQNASRPNPCAAPPAATLDAISDLHMADSYAELYGRLSRFRSGE